MKTLLLHTCCGPCLAASMSSTRWPSCDVIAYFYNPNIHPITEHNKRLKSFLKYAGSMGIESRIEESYPLREFLRGALEAESNGLSRCASCYRIRFEKTAGLASELGYDSFSTTLLASPYQKREMVCEVGSEAGKDAGVEFGPFNFRDGWGEGRRIARQAGLYMQNYCGCIFSELESTQHEKRDSGGGRDKKT